MSRLAVLKNLSLRAIVSLALGVFALLIVLSSLLLNIPAAERNASQRLQDIFRYDLLHLQSTLNYMLRRNDMDGVDREVVVFAEHPAHTLTLVSNESQRIVSAARKQLIGQSLADIEHFDPDIALQVSQTQQFRIIPSVDNPDLLYGYTPLLFGSQDNTLRSSYQGLLLCRYDMRYEKALARHSVLNQTWASIAILGLLALVLWAMVDFFITRRITRLVHVSDEFANGNLDARCAFQGYDELTYLGHAFDRMAAQIQQEQEDLSRSEERLQLALDSTEDGLWDWNLATNEVYFSPRWQTMLGYQPGELEPVPRSWEKLVHPDDKTQVLAVLTAHLEGQTPYYQAEHRLRHTNGDWIWILTRGKVVKRDDDGKPLRFVGTHVDINERKRTEKILQRQALILEQMSDGVVISDPDGQILDWNRAAQAMFGYRSTEIIGKSLSQLYEVSQTHDLAHEIKTHLKQYGHWLKELHFVHKNGSEGVCETVAVPLADNKGDMLAVISVNRNITLRRKAEAQIRYLATHDPLTSLMNRAIFMDTLNSSLAAQALKKSLNALLFIDLDGFKAVNDQLGHDMGDRLLEEVARRLQQAVRKTDTVARLGGDEFVILLLDVSSETVAINIAEKILSNLGDAFELDKQIAHIGGSIGIALFPLHAQSPDDLIKKADQAMYQAKHAGRGCWVMAT